MRDRLSFALKVVVSLALIVFAFSRIDLARVGAELAGAQLGLLILAFLMYELAIVVNGAKWQALLRAQGVSVPFIAVMQFLFVGFFFNNLLPANVGGDVMRAVGLARYTDKAPEAAVSVVVDRIIGLMAYMASASVAALVLVNLGGRSELQKVEWVAFFALAVLAFGFALLLSRRLRGLVSRIFAWKWLSPLAPIWDRVSEAFNAYRFSYGALALAFAIGIIGIICTALVNWLVSRSMGGQMTLGNIFLINPLIALVLTLPISVGGIGLSQAAYPFFFGLVGVPAAHALAVSIVMQGIALLASLPGAVLWLRFRSRAAAEAAPAAPPS